tara:strand:- start:29 stop:517 length:489 start_codon:yes stop_codon:yes gene_type:complete
LSENNNNISRGRKGIKRNTLTPFLSHHERHLLPRVIISALSKEPSDALLVVDAKRDAQRVRPLRIPTVQVERDGEHAIHLVNIADVFRGAKEVRADARGGVRLKDKDPRGGLDRRGALRSGGDGRRQQLLQLLRLHKKIDGLRFGVVLKVEWDDEIDEGLLK